jgi:hypothetical protein
MIDDECVRVLFTIKLLLWYGVEYGSTKHRNSPAFYRTGMGVERDETGQKKEEGNMHSH